MTDHLSWVLTAGFRRVVLYAVGPDGPTGDSLHTSAALPVPYDADGSTVVLDDGTLSEQSRVSGIAPAVLRFADVVELRRWRARGYRVAGVFLSAGRGAHVVWDEPVAVVLRPFVQERGGVSGTRLVMRSSAFGAAVETGPDLLELAAPRLRADGTALPWPGSAELVLPVPGLTVTAAAREDQTTTVTALNGNGNAIASAESPGLTSLTLPANTVSVRVEATGTAAADRPALLTYLPRVGPSAVYVFPDGTVVTGADGNPLTP